MDDLVLLSAMCCLTLSVIVALVYMLRRDSSISDRVLLLDSLSYNIIGIIALLAIYLDSIAYIEAILLIGILAFTSTIALCRFIERGVVIERKRGD
jgi:multicomponent Na+:H+ antiporter subunit F